MDDDDLLQSMRFDDEPDEETNPRNMEPQVIEAIVEPSTSSTSSPPSSLTTFSGPIENEHANFQSFLKRVSTIKYWPSINNRLTLELRLRVKSFVIKIGHPPSCFEKLSFAKRKKNKDMFSYEENAFLILDNDNNAGAQEVLCFGSNQFAQLGLGGVLEHETNKVEDFIIHPFLSSLNIADITYGKDFFVLVTTEGLVYTWGNNLFKQLGLGDDSPTIAAQPTLVTFPSREPRIKYVQCAHRHTLALDDDHIIWMWGHFKDLRRFARPVEVIFPLLFEEEKKFFLKVVTGRCFCAALDSKGNVLSWGPSISQPNTWENIPKKIAFVEDEENLDELIIDIACGDRHLMALTNMGNIFYYGGVSKEIVEFKKPVRLFDTRATYIAISAWQSLSVAVAQVDPSDEVNFCSILGQTRSRPIGGLPYTATLKEPIQRPFRTPFEEPELAMTFYLAAGTRSLVHYDRQLYLRRIYSPFERRLVSLFNNPDSETDVKFVFPADEQRVINAHRFFLKVRSPYMASFLSETWNASRDVLVKDTNYETFYFYIFYLYTGQLELNWRQAGALLDFAECTLERSLVKACIELLLESIDNVNCLYIYDLMAMHAPDKAHHVLCHIRRHYGSKVAKEALCPKRPAKSGQMTTALELTNNNKSSLMGSACKKTKNANLKLSSQAAAAASSPAIFTSPSTSSSKLSSPLGLHPTASGDVENCRRSVRLANKVQRT